MGDDSAPSGGRGTHELAARVELGMLRNGLGSIRNLELLLKSIKVGQKGLFAAVSAVHADCAPMIANAREVAGSLGTAGVEKGCADRVAHVLSSSLTELENVLAVAVDSGRLSVAQRLKLERDLSRCARELSSALPLVSLLERASRPRPVELTPVDVVHASSADRPDQKSISVFTSLPSDLGEGLSVDLEAARMLVALGVALVMDGDAPGHPLLSFRLAADGAPVTTLALGEGSGARVRVPALRLSSASVSCAEVAARSLGGRFEYERDARRVCIYWPVS